MTMRPLKTIDAHAGGGPFRLVVEGMPTPAGKTMRARTEWMARHGDHLRRVLMLEPRGHRDMSGAMFTEPVSAGAHAGVIFMNGDGYQLFSGHSAMAATTIALERRLVMPGGDGGTVRLDTASGVITATTSIDQANHRVARVGFQNVPSFVVQGGLALEVGERTVRADVAFGGAFYAVVDAESVGLGVEIDRLASLRRLGQLVAEAADAVLRLEHPFDGHPEPLHGTVFTAPAHGDGAHLRCLTVLASGHAGRSPSGSGLSAVMAVLDAMGLLGDNVLDVEGLLGPRFTGRVLHHTLVGEVEAIVPVIEGSAWIVGESLWFAADDDPLALGVSV